MADLKQLTEAAIYRPGERVVHVTNHTTATVLQARAAQDKAFSARVIRNRTELLQEIKQRKNHRWFVNPFAQVVNFARVAASAPTVTVGDVQFSLGNLASVDKHVSTASTNTEAIFVFENSITSDEFGQFLSYYSRSEPSKMPTIVLAADNDTASLSTKISRYSGNFSFHEYYGASAKFWTPEAASGTMSLLDIVHGLFNNNTLAVANSEFSLTDIKNTDFSELSEKLSAAYAVIRSVNFEYNKFASAELTRDALDLIWRANPEKMSEDQRNLFYTIKIIFILWDLYLHEKKPANLDEAIMLSQHLGSDILKAHCQRLMNLNAGYSEFSRHNLEQAEYTFRRMNQDPMAIYCKNNALLNVMHHEGATTDHFKALVHEALTKCPTMCSMAVLLNNASVGALLDSRYEEAIGLFEESAKYNALPIHRLGIDVNKMLCFYMMGETIASDDLDRLVTRVDRANIDRRLGYHQTILLFNILRIQEVLGYTGAQTREVLRKKGFMDYEEVLEGKTSFAKFLEARLPTTLPQKKYKGQRGDFILRTDLVPIIHFNWS